MTVILIPRLESWQLKKPFRISSYTTDVLVVEVVANGLAGAGEVGGVDYLRDTPVAMRGEAVEAGIEKLCIR